MSQDSRPPVRGIQRVMFAWGEARERERIRSARDGERERERERERAVSTRNGIK